jgi:hypothetical protein
MGGRRSVAERLILQDRNNGRRGVRRVRGGPISIGLSVVSGWLLLACTLAAPFVKNKSTNTNEM